MMNLCMIIAGISKDFRCDAMWGGLGLRSKLYDGSTEDNLSKNAELSPGFPQIKLADVRIISVQEFCVH